MKFKLGEFFCGPGGIALGAILAGEVENDKGEVFGIESTWATDYDLDTCKTYSYNIHGVNLEDSQKVLNTDIRTLDYSVLEDIDGFAFGFPCNDFSIVGEAKGLNGEYGPLYSYGVELLRLQQPLWFVAENVGGLSSANEGEALKLIMSELKKVGYKLVAHLYKFEQYGVPQARHRIIIVGIRKDLEINYKVPAPTTPTKYKSASAALLEPEIPADSYNHEFTKQSKTVIERLKYIKPGENAWVDRIPENLRLNVKGAKLSNIYKRLHPDYPAYTVTGSGGGGTYMYHWEEHRALTSRERARLQTFPDSFVFYGSKGSVRKQIGMAVPPEGMKVIFRAILKTFAGVDYQSVEPSIRE